MKLTDLLLHDHTMQLIMDTNCLVGRQPGGSVKYRTTKLERRARKIMARGTTNTELSWWDSFERQAAIEQWHKSGRRGAFELSKYFNNARLAFRRRVNGSPDGETT